MSHARKNCHALVRVAGLTLSGVVIVWRFMRMQGRQRHFCCQSESCRAARCNECDSLCVTGSISRTEGRPVLACLCLPLLFAPLVIPAAFVSQQNHGNFTTRCNHQLWLLRINGNLLCNRISAALKRDEAAVFSGSTVRSECRRKHSNWRHS